MENDLKSEFNSAGDAVKRLWEKAPAEVAAQRAHSANPGPAMPKEFNVQQEGTKEERRAKAAELNKEAK